jgi:hypothetical protein
MSASDKVFSGSVTMAANAWTFIVFDTSFEYDGSSNLVLVADDNSGRYDSSPYMACSVYNTSSTQAIYAYSSVTNFNPLSPPTAPISSSWSNPNDVLAMKNHILIGIETSAPQVQQTLILSEGWNWFSPYVKVDNPINLLQMLEQALGENANMILSMEDGMTEYDGEEWFGDLDDVGLANTQMYMVLANADCTVEMEGMPADITDYEITIKPGWNWIGFPSAAALDVIDALANFAAAEGDIILSQNDGMTEYDGEDWFGDLETLEPGVGLMYFNSSDETKVLVYSMAAKAWVKRKE